MVLIVFVVGAVLSGAGQFGGASAPTSTNEPAKTSVPPTSVAQANTAVPPTSEPLIATETPVTTLTPVSSDTPLPTETPNLTVTALTNRLDAQATLLAKTATSPPADLTPEVSNTPLALTLIATQPITISDNAGRIIGDGEVRVYAPAAINFGDTGEIQVQIEANPQSNGNATLNPQPSPTPELVTPRATPTPLILVDNGRQFITVYEYMSATLRGVHLENFSVDAIPPNGVRHLTGSGTIYWWKWSISPKKDAIGIDNSLEIYIVPQSTSSESPIDSQSRTISFRIKVNDPNGQSHTTLIAVAGLIVILLVIGGVAMLIRARTQKSSTPATPNAPDWGEHRVFISYRRDDSLELVGRIYDRLVDHFGRRTIFKDMDSIQIGDDFRTALDSKVGRADVLLAVIGDRWLTITGADGKRRLDNPQDFVRLEIETALQRNIVVIPLLVRNARIPDATDLPVGLDQLSFRNGLSIRPDPDFHNDMDRLIKAIETALINASANAKKS